LRLNIVVAGQCSGLKQEENMSLDVKDLEEKVAKSSLGLIHEFKEFISRGNVVDLAVGVVIGGAFGAITTSLVKDVVMPPIGYLMSGIDFSNIKYVIRPDFHTQDPANSADVTKFIDHPEVAITYGNFINTVINFLIVAFVIFWVVKAVNLLKRHEAAKPVDPPVPSPEEKLLIEIRDLLAKGK
jgi:large conductance mechanosensitive channel